MQLQETLCYSFNYDMIFITILKIEPIIYSFRASLPYPTPMKNCGCAPGFMKFCRNLMPLEANPFARSCI